MMMDAMHSPRRAMSRRAGLTLTELMLVVVVLGFVMMKSVEVLSTSSEAQETLAVRELLDARLRRVSERLANHLRQAGRGTIQDVPEIPETSDSIRYRRLVDYDPMTGRQWGVEETIFFQPHGEPSGKGSLVWNAGAGPMRWASEVSSVRFSRDGRRLRIDIEATATGARGDVIRLRRTTDVTIQN